MHTKTLSIIVSMLMTAIVIELVRREKLNFKYASGWLFASLAALFFSVFDRTLYRIAYWFGFVLPSNFIFFTFLIIFVFLSLLLTIFLCQQNKRNDIMAQRIALLEKEIEEIKK